MLDLERCSFLSSVNSGAQSGPEPSPDLRCWASGHPNEVTLDRQRELCLTSAHCSCPRLDAALASRSVDLWTDIGQSARIAAESCLLAEARLEVQSERLSAAVSRIFGSTS